VRPHRPDIAAPELPPSLRWLNAAEPPRMSELTARGPVLVHFLDFAQLNSVRALPYQVEWDARYGDAGLTTLGINSPRFPFSAEPETVAEALGRLGVEHPVAVDSRYSAWHDYGCKGWPSLFLWGTGGALRWYHFGEGDYTATEEAIQAELRELDALRDLPAPLEPLRPTDAPGTMVARPTDELFPGGSASEPWRGGGEPIVLEYAGAGAHASVAGAGERRVELDAGEAVSTRVGSPGLVDLALHPRHELHSLRLEADAGVEVYSVSFSPGLP
jgi:hypothetical protein